MSDYAADVRWTRGDQPFTDRRYARRHEVRFDGGHVMPGSSSPHVVKVPFSDPAAVDPEELFIASLSTCHMLWFLDFAARAGWVVDAYDDHATGTLGRDAEGKEAMTVVTLHPVVRFAGPAPSAEAHEALHHRAHEACFIANSVKVPVHVVPDIA